MSDAISTIQLGVATKEALEHLTALRSEFAALKKDMIDFANIGSSSENLKRQSATAAGAIEQLTRELNRSRMEAAALKNQLDQLSAAESQSALRGIQTYMDAEKQKTKTVVEESKKRQRAQDEEAEAEVKRRFSKSKSVKSDGGYRLSTSEHLDEEAFTTQAIAAMLKEQENILRASETNKLAIERAYEAEHRSGMLESALRDEAIVQDMVSRQAALLDTRTRLEQEAEAEHRRLMFESHMRDIVASDERIKQAEREAYAKLQAEAIFMNRVLDKNAAEAQKLALIQQQRDVEMFNERTAEANRIAQIQQQRDVELHNEKVREAKRLSQIQQERDLYEHNERERAAVEAEQKRIRDIIKDNNYTNSPLQSQIRQTSLAAGLVDSKQAALAIEMYGPKAVDNVANLADMKAKLAQATAAEAERTREAARHMREHADAMRDAHSAARGLAGGFHEMWLTWGNIVPLIAGFAIAATLKDAVQGFIDVQYQLTFVNSLSGDARTNVNGLTESLHKVSEELGVMPSDAAKGLRALAQAGLDAQQAMFVLPTAFKLATVGELDLGQASQALTGIMNAFGKTVGQTEAISDTLVKAAADSNASVVSLMESMKMAAPTAKQFNVSLEETATILTALAKSNITGTAAGTATKNMIKEMAAPTTQAVRDMMRDILGGFSAYNSEGLLKPITQQVEELRKQLERFDKESQAAILVKMFGERGDKAFFSLLKYSEAEINKMLSNVSDSAGKTSQVFFDLRNTVKGQWQLTVAEVDSALNVVGKNARDGLMDMMRDIRDAFKSGGLKDALVGLTQTATTLGEAAIKYGPPLLAMFAVWKTSSMIVGGVASVTTAFVGMKAALIGTEAAMAAAEASSKRLTAVLMLNPYVRITAIVLSLAAAYFILRKRKETAADSTAKELKDLGDIAKAMEDEASKLDERNRLRAKGVELAALEEQMTLSSAEKNVALLESQIKAQKELIETERKKLPGRRDTVAINNANADIERNEPLLAKAKADAAAIRTAAAHMQRARDNAKLYDAVDAAGQAAKDRAALKTGSEHYIPTEDNSRSAAGLAKAENQEILEEYRHAEQMAKDRYNNETKLADAYYKAGVTKANEYYEARAAAQARYETAQGVAQKNAEADIRAIAVPKDREDIQKQLDTSIARIKNKSAEQKQQDALNESYRVETEVLRTLGEAREYAEKKLPSIEAAQRRAQAHELEAHSLSLLDVEEQNVQKARQSVREEYERSADDIKQKIALVDDEIARNQALIDSSKQVDDEWLRANDAVEAAKRKKAALQGSLDLNASASERGQANAGATAKQINEQNKWNVALQRSIDLAGKMDSAFGKVGKSVGGLTTAFVKYQKGQDDISKRLAERIKLSKNETEVEQAKQDAQSESVQAEMGYYADLTGAAKGFFDEKSKGYALMEAAEKAFRVIELAYATESFLRKSGLLTAFTGLFVAAKTTEVATEAATVAPTVAAESAKATASGVTAFAKTLASLPFPLNVAAGAAVLALLIGAGVKMAGGGGGGGGMSISEERQKYNGTGKTKDTAYDWELQKSESIDKSLQQLKDNSDIALQHSSKMLSALQGIKDGISGMVNVVLQSSGLRGTRADADMYGVGSFKTDGGLGIPILGGIAASLGFGKTTVDMRDTGLKFGSGQTIGSILNGGVNVQGYTDIHKDESSWWGASHDESDTTYLTELDGRLKEQLGLTVKGLRDSILESADTLNVGGKALTDSLDRFQFDISRISLKGLKPEEVQAELEAAFSRLGDDMARYAVTGLEPFTKAGENYFQTLVRVASGVDQAKYALEKLRLTAIDYTQVTNKQGDVATEIVRQSIVQSETTRTAAGSIRIFGHEITLFDEKMSGVGEIINDMNGSVTDLTSAYQDLMTIRKEMNAAGVDGQSLSRDMLRGAGGLDALKDGVHSYFEKFLSEEEQIGAKTAELQSEFQKLGVSMPMTKDGFKDMINGIDLSTESGQKLYGQLVVLSGQFAELADETGNIIPAAAATQRAAINKLIESSKKWLDIANNAKSLLDDIDAAINGTKDSSARIAELWSMMTSTSVGPEQQLELAGELKDLILDRYQLEKDNAQSLIDLGKSLRDYVQGLKIGDMSPLTLSEKLATATSEYQITLAQARAGDQNAMSQLQDKAGSYLDLARQFYASNDQYTNIFNAVTSTLDDLGAAAQATGQTQLSVATSQLGELQQLREKVAALSEYATGQYQDQILRLADSLSTLGGIYDRLGLLSPVPDILLSLPAEIAGALSGATTTTSFAAVNGSHASGLTYVPFDGYVAELHKGERVLTASETKAYEGDDKYAAVVAELRAVRAELAALRSDQHQQTGDIIHGAHVAADRAAEKVVDGQKEAADNLAWKEKSQPTMV